jgi:hypothetical protein
MKSLLPIALGMAFLLCSQQSLAWWRCPDGHNLESRNNGREVRCFRPATTQTASLNTNCPQMQTPLGPVGAGYVRDWFTTDQGDACVTQDAVGIAKTAVPHNFCPSGYQHVKVAGTDRCTRSVPSSETTATVDIP